jgi:hypothetical protein
MGKRVINVGVERVGQRFRARAEFITDGVVEEFFVGKLCDTEAAATAAAAVAVGALDKAYPGRRVKS